MGISRTHAESKTFACPPATLSLSSSRFSFRQIQAAKKLVKEVLDKHKEEEEESAASKGRGGGRGSAGRGRGGGRGQGGRGKSGGGNHRTCFNCGETGPSSQTPFRASCLCGARS